MSAEYDVTEGLLKETIIQDPIVNTYTREDVEELLDGAMEQRTIKEAELEGIDEEIARFEEMIVKCDELGITAESVSEEI